MHIIFLLVLVKSFEAGVHFALKKNWLIKKTPLWLPCHCIFVSKYLG